ncbi:UDP-glucose/GDP-mannose dehydrogenase family protein [Pseudomonas sp. Teo4]|uniref:UDP-glucose dehydrogenase family protein n=1 Tax=Pseudomonas sp. Teo4 TaxID=3064528 RepID=UPI002AB8D7D1|nr:UDP-glucose/GDP-mannose dehydrogenase family protein [Pseudomonas sp. Teo4]MDZ3992901.1 UDP-glucose 6-dehydrogenase [Pseudomonas sp. Teo4]
MELCVIGAGYVGLVTAACFAEMGNRVVCLEHDQQRLAQLRQGHCPIHEPGLEALLKNGLSRSQLSFTDNWQLALARADVVFIAVGTPSQEDGSADLQHVLAVADSLGRNLRRPCLVVNKSTVPVGTAERVARHIAQGQRERGTGFSVEVASNPEFLKEGSALDDFMRPDRIIIGTDSESARQCLQRLYAPFVRNHERILPMTPRAAEFTKYAANAFLATKISFMNELAGLCGCLGVDIEQVRRGIGSDRRIGSHFIYAGCGYGGSCFPKDVRALIHTAEQQGYPSAILQAVQARNDEQKTLLYKALEQHFGGFMRGRVVALWGMAFKPGTDDLREAPSLVLLDALLASGARVQACDPVALAGVAERYRQAVACGQLRLVDDPYACVEGADALVLVTEWKQFRQPDFPRVRGLMRMPVVFDGRNIYDPQELSTLGYLYHGIGRPQAGHCKVTAA